MSANHVRLRTVFNPLIKDKATFLETSAKTFGRRTLIQIELAPGGGNELHYHKTFEETFTAVRGRLGIQTDKEIHYLLEGESITLKAGQLHRFFNPSNEEAIVFNVAIEPGSEGFENSLQIIYGLASDGLTNRKSVPKNLYHLGMMVLWGDTYLPGWISWFEPVLHWFARQAIREGIDRELLARYT